jgi:hypothetical protein
MDAEIVAQIVAGFFSLLAVALSGVITYLRRKLASEKEAHSVVSDKLHSTRAEHNFMKMALQPSVNLGNWGQIAMKIQRFCEETHIDRFLILVCWNGKNDPNKTTAIYQYRSNPDDFEAYIGVDLDDDYKNHLQQMKYDGHRELVVAELKPGLIKSIYDSEGLKQSIWFPLGAVYSEEQDAWAFRYCSFASHIDKPFSNALKQKCQNLVWEIKDLIQKAEPHTA